MDELRLIMLAKEGDLNSFNQLVLIYQDQVYNQAYRVMGEHNSAEDATQEAFISAFRKMHTFRGGSFRAWIFRIVTNACYDELRKRKRRPTTPLEPLNDNMEEIESPKWMMDTKELPEDSAQRAELAKAIQSCIDQLSDDFRMVVILVDIQGFNYQEASDVLNKPLGTIKSRLARARNNLRTCLQGSWELLPAGFRLGEEAL
jgi:RNA polymerase sigma-70 factor (ECF subfamily)